MNDVLISLLPDWTFSVVKALLIYFFLFLLHHERRVTEDLTALFRSPDFLCVMILTSIGLFVNWQEVYLGFKTAATKIFFTIFECCIAILIVKICIYRNNIIQFILKLGFFSITVIILLIWGVFKGYSFFIAKEYENKIIEYIIAYTSVRNIVDYVFASFFEYVIDKIFAKNVEKGKISIVKKIIILGGIISILIISYKTSEYEKERPLRERREAEEREYVRVRLEAEAMLKNNMSKAQNGDAKAQYQLGFYFREYAHDKKQAIYWFKKSAENNFAKSQYILGCHYSGKLGSYHPNIGAALVETDYTKALYWHKRAAENGFSASNYELYCMYFEGIGLGKNYCMAYMYLFTLKLIEGKKFHHRRELEKLSTFLTKSQIKREQKKAQKRLIRIKNISDK